MLEFDEEQDKWEDDSEEWGEAEEEELEEFDVENTEDW